MMWRVLVALVAALVSGCSVDRTEARDPAEVAQPPATMPTLAEIVVTVQEAVQEVAPTRPSPPPAAVHPAAVDLIIRWEVTSRERYERALSRPIWPGGASGITWGIGYDAGHQTPHRIRADWSQHPQVERMAQAAGLTGQRAAEALPAFRDIVVPWDMAVEVFRDRTLPAYRHLAARAFGPAFESAPPTVQGALVSVVYNRGPSMTGGSRREMREIRDVCLPAGDAECVAAQLTSMCRIWRGSELERGLCGRRADEAMLARRLA
jgi:hypothetical protein